MCVAYPGTVIAVRPAEHKATVDFSGTTVDALTGVSDIKEGDVYLLCSDGLTDMLPDSIIYTLLAEGSDANTLCDAAVAAGGLDNVSCCVLQF